MTKFPQDVLTLVVEEVQNRSQGDAKDQTLAVVKRLKDASSQVKELLIEKGVEALVYEARQLSNEDILGRLHPREDVPDEFPHKYPVRPRK
ncbi:MAG: hypothetical protein AB7K24_04015 [Gemmataceae bacterium]